MLEVYAGNKVRNIQNREKESLMHMPSQSKKHIIFVILIFKTERCKITVTHMQKYSESLPLTCRNIQRYRHSHAEIFSVTVTHM